MTEPDIAELEARLNSARAAPDDVSGLISALNALGWEIRLSQSARAAGLASEARELAIELGDKSGQARAARVMSMTQGGTDIRKALECAEEAHLLYEEVGDKAGIAAALDFRATLAEFIGDLSTSLDYAFRALAIAREIGDKHRQGYCLSSVGGILGATGDEEAAFTHLREALALFQEVEDKAGEGRIYSRLTTLARKVGRAEEAAGHAERALQTSTETNNAFMRAAALTALGELQSEQGNNARAEELLRDALDSYPKGSRGGFGVTPQIRLGRLLAERGALQEAEVELTSALERTLNQGVAPADGAEAHEALADLRERTNELPQAITHLREAMRLRQEASQTEAKSQLANVEIRSEMEAAKKDAEIHRLKFVELQEMQSRLVEAERGALVGKLAAGTAHELNTPLGVLRSNLDLFGRVAARLEKVAPTDPVIADNTRKLVAALRTCSATSGEAIDRIAALAGALKRFTRLDQADQGEFDVVEGVDSAVTLLEPTLPADITVQRRLKPVPTITAWPRDLNQAFMTVLVNAAEAIEGAGTVTVTTEADNGHVRVHIEDTGRGMDAEAVAMLFDVGFSDGGGRVRLRTGLSAAHATVLRHDGTLVARSEPGNGTTVTFSFPAP